MAAAGDGDKEKAWEWLHAFLVQVGRIAEAAERIADHVETWESPDDEVEELVEEHGGRWEPPPPGRGKRGGKKGRKR